MLNFHSNYKLGQMIGSGFSSNVYKCTHLISKVDYACKVVVGQRVNRSKNEEFITQLCKHPNINEIHNVYYQNDDGNLRKYIISELGKGDIFSYLENKDFKVCEHEAKYIIKQMTQSIDYLHSNNICHKDIKLQNFIYTFKDDAKLINNYEKINVKLIDLEFSERYDKYQKMSGRKGTRSFISPEVFNNLLYCNKVDIWSLGICTYMMLSNVNPILKEYDKSGRLNFNIDLDIKELDHVSKNCKDFLKHLLQKNPEKRLDSNETLNHDWLIQL